MGNFWTTSEGEDLSKSRNSTSFDSGNSFDPIPKGTVLPAVPIEATNAEYNGYKYINIKWQAIDGTYKNRTVYHKVKVFDKNPETRNRALRMLTAIDKNAGNPLIDVEDMPTDQELARLIGKPMDIRLGVWGWKVGEKDPGGNIATEAKSGNNVSAIGKLGELSGKAPAPAKKAVAAKPSSATAQADPAAFDDDIPF